MRRFSIREACGILDVKSHVLRYWEQEFPLLSPEKDSSGRRVYTTSDLRILFRIRCLLYTRGYTIDGARKKLWEEISGKSADTRAVIHSIRMELLDLSNCVHSWNERFERIHDVKKIP